MKVMERLVYIPAGHNYLEGVLCIPYGATAIVAFVHGSGSSRLSPRNTAVAKTLQDAGLATLLCDLLTAHEGQDSEKRFDIELLTSRVIGIIEWLSTEKQTASLSIGLFGASTGAAAALEAAAELPDVQAVVSRGGRPDLAMKSLPDVEVPVLLIVGGEDREVLELNRLAYEALRSERALKIVEGATHLFEEEGALEAVAILARDWFVKYLLPVSVT